MDSNLGGRKVLILGGLGFIGSNLALRLVEQRAEVTLLDALINDQGGNRYNVQPIRDQVRIRIQDIRDSEILASIIRDQEVIFSLAAQTSHLGSMQNPLDDLDVNCRAQLFLLECCRRTNPGVKIVFTSTRQIYGRPQYLPLNEQHLIQPVDVNGVSKYSAEQFFSLYSRVYGLRTTCLRLTNTYGPRLNLRGASTGFVGVFLRKALMNSNIDIYGTGTQRRDFNYIDDVIDALLLAASDSVKLNGCSFNLGHTSHYSIRGVAEILRLQTGISYRCIPFPSAQAAIDPGDCYSDFSQYNAATGWTPKVDLEDGLARTIKFFQEHRTHYWEPYYDSGV